MQALSTQTLALKPCKPFRQVEPNIILLHESNDQPLLELPNVHSSAQCSKALSSMCTCKCHCKVCRQTSRGFIQAILRHNEAAYVAGKLHQKIGAGMSLQVVCICPQSKTLHKQNPTFWGCAPLACAPACLQGKGCAHHIQLAQVQASVHPLSPQLWLGR